MVYGVGKCKEVFLASSLVMVFAQFFSGVAHGTQLDVSAYITNGTCDVATTQPVIMFAAVAPNVFNKQKQTVQIASFNLEVKNCTTIGGGGLRPGVLVNGDVSPEDPYLFRTHSPDNAQGIGVLLREGEYKGHLAGFYDPTSLVSDGHYTNIGQPGDAVIERKLSYTFGLSNGASTSSVSPGDVLATLQFSFAYN